MHRHEVVERANSKLKEIDTNKNVTVFKKFKVKLIRIYNLIIYSHFHRFFTRTSFGYRNIFAPDGIQKDVFRVYKNHVEEHKHYWIIPYNTFEAVEYLDLNEMMIGVGPMLFSKEANKFYFIGLEEHRLIEKIRNNEWVDPRKLENEEKL